MKKIVLGALVLVSSVAFAAPYGTAGCGLGSMAFGDQKGAIQIVAATLNGLFGTQTFGITSGTSNCGEAAADVHKTAQVFVEANREALAKDMSRGSGETIASLSHIAGCADVKEVGSTLQTNFKAIFPAANVSSEQVTQSLLETLKGDKSLSCSKLS
jgi:hypothetical protein